MELVELARKRLSNKAIIMPGGEDYVAKVAAERAEKKWVEIEKMSELWENIDRIIRGDLGQGDVLSLSLTPTAIFDRLDDTVKPRFTANHICAYMLREQEKELLRRRLRAPAPAPRFPALRPCTTTHPPSSDDPMEVDSSEEIEESPYLREARLKIENNDKKSNENFRIFLKAIMRLGGDENVAHITSDAMHKLITQELDPSDNPYWTVEELNSLLYLHKLGAHPIWTFDHHNRMLKAIQSLGGDLSKIEVVNPKAVLELMDADESMDPMTISGVRYYLDELRSALKEDPNHPLGYPKKPTKNVYVYFQLSDQEILDVAAGI